MDNLILTPARSDDGQWQVEADDGSICESPFASRGVAQRWIEDREPRSMTGETKPWEPWTRGPAPLPRNQVREIRGGSAPLLAVALLVYAYATRG